MSEKKIKNDIKINVVFVDSKPTAEQLEAKRKCEEIVFDLVMEVYFKQFPEKRQNVTL